MLSRESVEAIAKIFCGDERELYVYKSGSKLVDFFNSWSEENDMYGQGFPSRWIYTANKINKIIINNGFDRFITYILGTEYIIKEHKCNEVEAIERADKIWREFNMILRGDKCAISRKDDKYWLVNLDDDYRLIGSGGFADVFYQNSTGYAVKKLKREYVVDEGIRSRFKREYNITSSLQDIDGIIRVFSFDEGRCTYSMEYAQFTLYEYFKKMEITDDIRLQCIRNILIVMVNVHKRHIIHRDLSPSNIFIVNGYLKIADFGLGKDLKGIASHQTLNTQNVGQYYYTAPEVILQLKDADKRSDVFSIGRIINFIMTSDPMNDRHVYGPICNKATNSSPELRFDDAEQLWIGLEKQVEYIQQSNREEAARIKIRQHIFDKELENYLYYMSEEELSTLLRVGLPTTVDAIFWYMGQPDINAERTIQGIEENFRKICAGTYEAYDPFARLADKVIRSRFEFSTKEIAARILSYVAWKVNRFEAQNMVRSLINQGVDPLIEEVLENR